MRLLKSILIGSAALALLPSAAMAQEIGWTHDSPRRANPPVTRPAVKPCVIEIVDHGFRDFEPKTGKINAAKQCRGKWQKIVLEMDGSVQGHQYDRIGTLEIGGVTLLRLSTPEPSPGGIAWTVEKDLTDYAALFKSKQNISMTLGNVVNEKYTGVFHIKARILFYPAAPGAGVPDIANRAADLVTPLTAVHKEATDTIGTIKIPGNTERLLMEVYATGSGGGCEEFWYYALPADKVRDGAGCKTELGPYREVQVEIDGEVAGIAAPYPHIYTGGWGNPYIWYQIPAPRAFDIAPLRFDLTPFIGKLNDNKPHKIRIHVVGVPTDKEGWTLLPNMHIWQDSSRRRTKGELIEAKLSPLAVENDVRAEGATMVLNNRSVRRFVARGAVNTSRGRVETTVEQSLSGEMMNRWQPDDNHDGLRGNWTDRRIVSRRRDGALPQTESDTYNFGFEGSTDKFDVEGVKNQRTIMSIFDNVAEQRSVDEKVTFWQQSNDRFDGTALIQKGVPPSE